METACKKVLIISHNALSSTQNNGKTLKSFFTGWPREKLAQLYIYNEYPDFEICGRFYRITDRDVLKANLSFSIASGMAIEKQEPGYNPGNPTKKMLLHAAIKRRYSIINIARSILWRKSKYMSDSLKQWIKEFKPDVIFFMGSSHSFMYRLALRICEMEDAAFILYLTDDYTYIRNRISPLAYIEHYDYMKWFGKGVARAHTVFTISPKMKKEYTKRFSGKNMNLAISCTEEPFAVKETKGTNKELSMLYAGNVESGRWKVLYQIAQAARYLNDEMGRPAIILEIYSPIGVANTIEKKLCVENGSVFKGSLNRAELRKKMQESDVLLFTESFGRLERKITRLSLSTKIPEYLNAGKPILAIGPKSASSIEYLAENDLAVILTDTRKPSIVKALREQILDAEKRNERAIICRKFMYEQKKHRGAKELIWDTIQSIGEC